jgi:ribosomal-protein-alanine N-acetyltransferase
MLPRSPSTPITAGYGWAYATYFRIPTPSSARMRILQRVTTKEPPREFCIDIDGAAVGGIGIRIGEDVHLYTAELGYWLSEDFWGHGIASEAVPAVTEYCFENFPLRRISAEPYANNPASVRVLEKAGFALEGRLKNNVFKDGQILDSLLYECDCA